MNQFSVQLNKDLLESAADFLNTTPIQFEIISFNGFYLSDVPTGARILNHTDIIIFSPSTTEEQLFLKLKFNN